MSKIINEEKIQEEKKNRTKTIVIAVSTAALVVLAIVAMFAARLLQDFDAQRYTKAVLDQTFKGEVKSLVTMVDGVSEESLGAQYENGIVTFVKNSITAGIEMDEELQTKYNELGKQIFASMKYEVKEAEKISRKEYQVPVEYQVSDIFAKFTPAVNQEMEKLRQKVEDGEYEGTEEEILAQMESEFLNDCYVLLEGLLKEAVFAEPETMILTVKMDETDAYGLDEAEIHNFITKILNLGEIQD